MAFSISKNEVQELFHKELVNIQKGLVSCNKQDVFSKLSIVRETIQVGAVSSSLINALTKKR